MRRFALALIAVLAVPASAAAKGDTTTIAPPGNSGVSQYVETVPTAHGGQPTSSVHNHGGGSGNARGNGGGPGGSGGSGSGSAISPSTQRAIASQGATGAAAAAFIQATAPTGARAANGWTAGRRQRRHRAGAGGAGGSHPAVSQGEGASPANAVFHALTGSTASGGLGSILPIILIASLIVLSALAILRRRRTTLARAGARRPSDRHPHCSAARGCPGAGRACGARSDDRLRHRSRAHRRQRDREQRLDPPRRRRGRGNGSRERHLVLSCADQIGRQGSSRVIRQAPDTTGRRPMRPCASWPPTDSRC